MVNKLNEFATHYHRMLKDYLLNGSEIHLLEAYELGRRALGDGLGLLDITYAHQTALLSVMQESVSSQPHDKLLQVRIANRFLDETLSPFEVSRLSSMDANAALRRLYDVLEEEAKRIAHVLHDESAQMLAIVYLELADILRMAPDAVVDRVNIVIGHLDEVREQIRRLSHELRPLILDQLGVVPALNFLASGVMKRSNLNVTIKGDTGGRLSQAIEVVLYRSVQEALNNVVRHAKASKAEIRLWVEDELVHCTVRDDGIGFEVPEERKRMFKGLGLIGIHERIAALHGECKINSKPGEGTELQVVIPL
ncbi:MAG: ATP-binding protein [Pseudomonadota bacterium]